MIRPKFKRCAWKRGTQKRGLKSFPWNRCPNLGYCIWHLVLQWIWITAPFRRLYNFTRFLEGFRGSCNNKAWSKSKSTDVNWPEIQLRHHLPPVFRQGTSAVKHICLSHHPCRDLQFLTADINANPHLVSPSSFTWLCGQVHRNLLSKFTGQVVELFDEEFRHLYALSKPVRGPKSPPRTMPFLFSKSWAPQRSLPYSNEESANTLSDPFSSLSAGSTHQTKQTPRTLIFSSNFTPQSPLHRVNSFHSYVSFTAPPPQKAIQANYYQPHYVADNSAVLYNNMNIYRPIRLRQEEPNRTGLSSPWRCLHKANLFA